MNKDNLTSFFYSLISLWSENILCKILIFLIFHETCFMAYHVVMMVNVLDAL